MTLRKLRNACGFLGMAVLTFGPARQASANFRFTITDVGTGSFTTIVDNDGTDQNTALKAISYNATLDHFDFNVQLTSNYPGSSTLGSLVQDTTISTNNTSSTTDILKIQVWSDGTSSTDARFTATPGGSYAMSSGLSSTNVPNAADSATFYSKIFDSGGSTVSSTVSLAGIITPSTPASVGSPVVGFTATDAKYSLYNEMNITLVGNSSANFNAATSVVPEPAFYQLSALIGLGGLGLLRWRRRK